MRSNKLGWRIELKFQIDVKIESELIVNFTITEKPIFGKKCVVYDEFMRWQRMRIQDTNMVPTTNNRSHYSDC